jgi:hypothetical protein
MSPSIVEIHTLCAKFKISKDTEVGSTSCNDDEDAATKLDVAIACPIGATNPSTVIGAVTKKATNVTRTVCMANKNVVSNKIS